MTTLINFADERMTISQEKNKISALKHGVDQVICYNKNHISPDFYKMNKEILDADRGAGYWLWKPYFIYQTMLDLPDGDILIYSDSGIEFIQSVNHIIERMDGKPVYLFSNGWKHEHWCKKNVAMEISPVDMKIDSTNDIRYRKEFEQVQASLIFLKVNDTAKKFVKEWLLWCQFPGFIDDSKSPIGDFPEFQESRHDQMILTCMAIKWGVPYENLWPDKIWQNQRHRWPHSDYPAIIRHHRLRNNEW